MSQANHILVQKRDGRQEPLDLEKIHRVIDWASWGLNNVSVSEVELKAKIQFYNGITTKDIHETIIRSASDLISQDNPDYQFLAARLAIFHLRKIAFGDFDPPPLYSHIKKLVRMGKYDEHILSDYTREEIDELNTCLVHDRDLALSYVAVNQLEGKYLVQDRTTKQIYESPQFLYMLVGMCLFARYKHTTEEERKNRLAYVKRFYESSSTHKISLPTPIMAGVRTPTRQFSSCVLIDCDDSLDSINASTSAVVRYISQRAGIGMNAGRIRALGSAIRGGEAEHTGCIPFLKLFQAAVKSCSQGGVRGGAATVFYPLWHLEVENLLVLKNNRGVEDNRVRHMDYGVQINKTMYSRLISSGHITLFSPHDVPDLYDAFFADQDKFERLYQQYERNPDIRKKTVSAQELFSLLAQERASTGRIYIQHVDHCNTHSAFNPAVAPVRQSNLCMEITLPTVPLTNINDAHGEIALCTLSGINLGKIDNLDELAEHTELLVRALDELLDYQNYPVEAARTSSMKYRTLGIGVINYAYYLAKNDTSYSNPTALKLTHELFEAIQYHLLKASNKLAQEKGACQAFDNTNYAKGLLPIDTYKKDVDKLCDAPLLLDWESLRADIKQFGLRNATVTALMPSETSSQISNATNGIEPPRGLITIKQSKDGILKQVVPDIENLKDKYELLWDFPDNKGYLSLVAIMQKFVDQSISANTNYDPSKFSGGKVPLKLILEDMMTAYKFGVKTLYYHNTRDNANDAQHTVKSIAKLSVFDVPLIEPEIEYDMNGCEGGACTL